METGYTREEIIQKLSERIPKENFQDIFQEVNYILENIVNRSVLKITIRDVF